MMTLCCNRPCGVVVLCVAELCVREIETRQLKPKTRHRIASPNGFRGVKNTCVLVFYIWIRVSKMRDYLAVRKGEQNSFCARYR